LQGAAFVGSGTHTNRYSSRACSMTCFHARRQLVFAAGA
jgi:hypothetical protein